MKRLFLVLVVFILTACVQQDLSAPAQELQQLLNSPDCGEQTCWAGIEPGITDASSALSTLETLYDDNIVTSKNDGKINGIEWEVAESKLLQYGYIGIGDKTVSEIYLLLKENSITVKDLIGILGMPDAVFVNKQIKCLGTSLFYSKAGIVASLDLTSSQSIGVEPEQNVLILRIMSIKSIENLGIHDGFFTPWDGYREYCPEK